MFLGWYDPDRKKTVERKLSDAIERYRRKWGRDPRVALVNPADATQYPGIEVRVVSHVAPNTFFVGIDAEPERDLLAA